VDILFKFKCELQMLGSSSNVEFVLWRLRDLV
jgi:hypothetical protein